MNDMLSPSAGKIMLVGIGPGSVDHMTQRARAAIAEADVVIGYVTYIKLVADLIEGKEIIRKSMTEELDRAVSALEAARAGKKVALISSGDAGVYGMAGPTYEVLFQAGWTPDDEVAVEIVPGASALNSCAALVGAPLTHDFCAISLSDLLTPWPTIARRLDAVAMADFVVALYNPKSGRRTRQIVEAQRLFLRHRRPDTPVAIVKSAYRRRENIVFTTLDQMCDADIGMLSTVLIGNSNTFVRYGLMVTPRGYANKYDMEDGGSTRDGERAGRSLSTGLLGWLDALRDEHAAGCRHRDAGSTPPPAGRLHPRHAGRTLGRRPTHHRGARHRRKRSMNETLHITDNPPSTDVVKPKIGSYKRHLLVCTGPRCSEDGASQILFDSLGDKFKAAGLNAGELRVKRSRVSCFAACKGGPIVCVQPDGTWYYNVTPDNMDRIIERHLCKGERVEDLVFHQAGEE